MKMRQAAMTLSAVLLSTAVAAAQTATQPQTQPQPRPGQPQTQQLPGQDARRDDQQRTPGARDQQTGRQTATAADRALATCLAIDNQAEIQVAEFAAQHLKNARAKQFAQQMVRDHRAMLDKLKEFGVDPQAVSWTADAGAEPRGDVAVQAGRTQVDVQVNRPATDPARAERAELRADQRTAARTADGPIDFAAIKREIAQQCVQSAKRELQTSDQPDQCYIGAQVVMHQHMLDALTVFERHASPQLSTLLAEAKQTTQQHLEDAKQILKSLATSGAAATAAAGDVGTIAR